jgi:hypothetical protein
MVADLGFANEDLAKDEIPAKQVLNHQGGHAALTPGWVVGPPILQIVWITGVRSPRCPKQRSKQLNTQHRPTIASGYDTSA